MRPLIPSLVLGRGTSNHFGKTGARAIRRVEVDAAGDQCHWCDRSAIRREIVGRVYPRVYLGACKAHVDNLSAIRRDRAAHINGLCDAKADHIKQLSAAKSGHRPKFAKGNTP
jgi:hypothetical protein